MNDIKKQANKFKCDLEYIVGDRLLQIIYSNNSVSATLGIDYFNQRWFTENHNRLIKLINKYTTDKISFSYSEY